jgi:hypothetical protein
MFAPETGMDNEQTDIPVPVSADDVPVLNEPSVSEEKANAETGGLNEMENAHV